MGQGVLYGGSMISISVVRVRAMGELQFAADNMNQNGCVVQQKHKEQFVAHQAIDHLRVAVTGRIFTEIHRV
jgi:hypothetical protein